MALFPNGFMPALSNNSDALLQAGLGLLSGRTGPEQAAMGLQGFTQARKENKTAKWLADRDPELAAAMQQGLISGGDAFKIWAQKTAEANKPKSPLEINGKLVDPTTYQVIADFSTPPKPEDPWRSAGGGLVNPNTNEWILPPNQKQPVDPVEERKAAAASLGLAPDDPRYQSYVLTGKMPREDAQPLSAGDKRAIQEADDMVLSNQTAIDALSKAEEINKEANSGFLSGSRAVLGNNLPDLAVPDWLSSPESSAATTEYDNLVMGSALGQLKAIFGGNPTEGERAILLDLQASSSKPPEVRKAILARAKAMAAQRLEFNKQRAAELRGGTYYQPRDGSAPAGLSTTKTGVSYKVIP